MIEKIRTDIQGLRVMLSEWQPVIMKPRRLRGVTRSNAVTNTKAVLEHVPLVNEIINVSLLRGLKIN